MKTLVIYVHPVENSFTSAVRDAVISGLTSAQHETRLRDLYAENFNPFLSAAERGLHHTPPSTRPELARDVEDLRSCLFIPLGGLGYPQCSRVGSTARG